MKKKILICIVFVLFISFISDKVYSKSDKKIEKQVNYNGNTLRVSIDGEASSSLPSSGSYYLTNYTCGKNTKVTWDNTNHTLNIKNGRKKGGVACYLTFKSEPKLSELPVGSYVSYTGSNGCSGNACMGQNANYVDSNDMGYCKSDWYKYMTNGWRIGYIKDGKAMLVSAGSPECVARTATDNSSKGNEMFIKRANALALKYCNSNYVDGDCTCTGSSNSCDSPSTDAWALGDTDFYYMTKAISGYGKRLASGSSGFGDSGGSLGNTKFCNSKSAYKECGYNNDLIDNGGYYWFAAQESTDSMKGMVWAPNLRYVRSSNDTYAYGLRFVISLKDSVYVIGGEGTMENPYIIGV